jgi:hypothetical protein
MAALKIRKARRRSHSFWPKMAIDFLGLLFPRKLRKAVWQPSADDLLQDFFEARCKGIGRFALRTIFVVRTIWLVMWTLLAGCERMFRAFPLTAVLFKLLGR